MLAPNELANVAVPKRKTWHALTHQAPTDQRVGSWANRLDPWEIGLCETIMGDRLVAHGYQLSGGYKAGVDNLVRYAQQGLRNRISKARRTSTVAYHKVRPQKDLAAQLTAAEIAMAQPDRAAQVEPTDVKS